MKLTPLAVAVFITCLVCPEFARADNVALLNQNNCSDVNGVPVATQWLLGHENANIANGMPVIQLDPQLIDSSPPIVAQFLYYHECGHHRLGHIVGAVINGPVFAMAFAYPQEYAADCFGLRTVQSINGVGPQDINVLMNSLATFTVPGGGHPPGPKRVRNMSSCP